MEETNHQTKIQRQRGILWLNFLPPNAYITSDCEFILLFRKGKLGKFPPNDPSRYASAFTKQQRDEWFTQIWNIRGTRQTTSQIERRIAAYPEEIVNTLIRMFSVKGDTILDPFLGSGTTVKLAIINERNSISYETDESLIPLMKKKISTVATKYKLFMTRRTNIKP